MAEAAALALASAVCSSLNLTGVNYLLDCEQLVRFLHHDDLASPPEWTIKFFTQTFVNHTANRSASIFKIHRWLNTVSNSLARQARVLQPPLRADSSYICTT
jgi:hypothetical protein